MSWGKAKRLSQQGAESLQAKRMAPIGKRYVWRSLVVIAITVVAAVGFMSIYGNGVVNAASALQGNPSSAGTLAIVGANGAQLYATPGGEAVDQLAPGKVLTAVGRSADSLWIAVHDDASASGWVEVNEVVLFGLDQLPVMVEGTLPETEVTPTVAEGTGEPAATEEGPNLLPTPTSTPLATATPLPTATFTPTPVPTETPTSLPTPSPTTAPTRASVAAGSGQNSLVAVVRGGGADLYDSPGGTVTQQLPTGTALTAWGQSADGQWLVVVASTGASGWVQSSDVVIFDTESLAVLDSEGNVPGGADATVEAVEGSAEATAPTSEGTASENAPASEETATSSADAGQITASVTVTDSRLNIRSGPGTSYSIVTKADPGDEFVVSGRNAEATWIEVVLPESEEGYGWVSAEFVTFSQPILGIPVSERAFESTPVTADPPAAAPVAQSATQNLSAPTGLSGRLVFQDKNGGTIYRYDLDTGELVTLTSGFDPAISPDGKTVAFTRFAPDHGLFMIGIDGSNERRIWNGSEGLRSPTWSPDGQWIGFVRQSGAFTCRDVGFGICLPDNPFLSGFPEASQPEFNLSRVDVNGENFRDIPALNTAQAPNWHQDGIVYQASTGLEITSDVSDAETKAVVQAPYYQDPNWQPTGNRIAFQTREGSHWEVSTINPDGSGQSALTRPATALVENLPSNVAPAWSPDGRSIVFLSNRDDENDAGAWRLWVMDADGSNQRPLPIDVPLDYQYTNEQSVSWGITG